MACFDKIQKLFMFTVQWIIWNSTQFTRVIFFMVPTNWQYFIVNFTLNRNFLPKLNVRIAFRKYLLLDFSTALDSTHHSWFEFEMVWYNWKLHCHVLIINSLWFSIGKLYVTTETNARHVCVYQKAVQMSIWHNFVLLYHHPHFKQIHTFINLQL